ncbi:MAG: dockerin type I domain-containing protein [Gammaproteobacteria bacterium]
MPRTKARKSYALLLASLAPTLASAADSIQPGTLASDPATICCLGVYLPITAGDDDRDATATLRYREAGAGPWRTGLALLRVRPDQISGESPPGSFGLPVPVPQFASSVLGLAAATTYDVEVTVTDPDGGGGVQSLTLTTAAVPAAEPATPNAVGVSSAAALTTALGTANPGDVITLAAGIYVGSFVLSRDGTAANPIIFRGAGRDTVTVDATGRSIGVTLSGDYTRLENLTVRGSDWGVKLNNTTGVVVRGVRVTDVNKGIDGRSGQTRGLYLCDNVLEGRRVWPDFANAIENAEGIVVTGQGHTVCHNRISGFGDALGLNQNTSLINAAIDFYGNDVLWTGDDGLELDYAHRNVRAFGNRVTNASMGVSFQPVWGGPVYVFRNVLVNMARSPFKLNNDPTGFYILNNTAVRTLGVGNNLDYAWPSLGYLQSDGDPAYAANFEFRNNLLIGVSAPAFVTTELFDARIDSNGWWPDGTFVFFNTWANLADLQANSTYEANGRIVEAQPFAVPVVLGATYATEIAPQNPVLAAGSVAVDGGQVIPAITDGFAGTAPDLGAWERGNPLPVYGVRPATDGDGDGVADDVDNCTVVVNASQLDADDDGYGNACDGDLNNSGTVTAADYAMLRSVIGALATSGPLAAAADLNSSGTVTAADYAILRAEINATPGPSGLRP